MGLTISTMAALLSVSDTTIKAWDKGRHRVLPGAAQEVDLLRAYTHRCVDAVVGSAAHTDAPMILVWHLTDDMPPGPARTLGAGWWRAVAAAAQERTPGITIGYASELDKITSSRDQTLSEAITPSILPPPRFTA
ncbi:MULTISPECIES: hypothetical protein [unclassified Actinomyces]|nr:MULTISPECIES: hypothetical protein [unclassified Actinomyces]MCL3789889.1 hypothetical protein [Actinomyces sp. 187325]MCL3792226.1 hypothetical protein [Actinomyces sp. 186855]MCL3794788.1 hypothetical protein [Actinomyces sp. 217892]